MASGLDGAEGDGDGDWALDPVHGEALVEPLPQACGGRGGARGQERQLGRQTRLGRTWKKKTRMNISIERALCFFGESLVVDIRCF